MGRKGEGRESTETYRSWAFCKNTVGESLTPPASTFRLVLPIPPPEAVALPGCVLPLRVQTEATELTPSPGPVPGSRHLGHGPKLVVLVSKAFA